MGFFDTTWKVLTRRKKLGTAQIEQSQLNRVLTTFDLTALGVGSTLGVGVYVIAGKVADVAGPAVILSFFIAAVASVFAGLCYAEFGARTPKAGSAYIYSYVCVGEFIAFVIGWNLILEYVIGSASVARGLSSYLDSLINHTLEDAFIEIAPIHVSFMAEYFDFFAFGVSIALAVALAFGMKESSIVNNLITSLNIGVIIFVVIVGSLKADFANWEIKPNSTNTTKSIGDGGFFPHGFESVIKGAATCFYGFVGFDCIATTGEEVKNPKRAIPISIIVSLLIIFLSYFSTSVVLTMMVPYYAQDVNAPFPHAFEVVGYDWAKWVVAIGGMFGLCASLFGAMLPLPRIIYAMASDSLIFKFLGIVNERFQSPVIGTILSGVLTGLMAALFKLEQLVDMMSIGTLMAYTIVAASVLLLRYERLHKNQHIEEDEAYTDSRVSTNSEDIDLITDDTVETSCSEFFRQLFSWGRTSTPTVVSEKVAGALVFTFCVLSIGIGLCVIYTKEAIADGKIWAIVLISVVVLLAVLTLLLLAVQPTSRAQLSFKVPLVPLIPALSIMINIYLMLSLNQMTWIRFGVWMAVGIPIYYFSLKLPTVSEPVQIYNKYKKQNGCDNPTFIFDDDVLSNGRVKNKRKAPPPPPLQALSLTDDVLKEQEPGLDQTLVLEALDEAIACGDDSDVLSNNVYVASSCDSPVALDTVTIFTHPIHDVVRETETSETVITENLVQTEPNEDFVNKGEPTAEPQHNSDSPIESLNTSDSPKDSLINSDSPKESLNNSDSPKDLRYNSDSPKDSRYNSDSPEELHYNGNSSQELDSTSIKDSGDDSDIVTQQDLYSPIAEETSVVNPYFPVINLKPVPPSIIRDSNNNGFELPKVQLRPVSERVNQTSKSKPSKITKSSSFLKEQPKPTKPIVKPTRKRVDSFNEVILRPVKRPSLEQIDVLPPVPPSPIPEPPPFKLEKTDKKLQEEFAQTDISNAEEKQQTNLINRPTSFQLKNVKLKPVVRRKSSKGKKTTGFRPSSVQLRSVHLKPVVNRRKSIDSEEEVVSGVSIESFVTSTRKLSAFKHRLESILQQPGLIVNTPQPTNNSSVNIEEIRESVNSDHIDRDDASKKLSEFLRKTQEN